MLNTIKYYYQQNSLNNRELAILLWILLALVFFIWKPDIRKSLTSVLKALAHKKILIPIIIVGIYALLEVVILKYLRIWDIFLIKDTIVWFLGTALVMLPNYEKVTLAGSNVKRLILDNIKLSFFLEFIANIYAFPLIVEFLLIPVLVIIVGMAALSEKDKKYQVVLTITNWLLTIYGITIIGHSLYLLISTITSSLTLATLYSLISYPVLTLFFLPCIYIFSLYATYEMLFLRVDWQLKQNTSLARYAKYRILKFANFDLGKLRLVNKNLKLELMNAYTKEQTESVIKSITN